MFKLLLGFIALVVAACAAFFSVQGVASLYSDQFLAVCIMASSLEIGKLVAATFLHRYWEVAGKILKGYLVLAVAVLMAITSLGIFGFLTSAYQKNFSQVELVDSKKEIFESKKGFIEKEILSLNDRIKTLNEARLAQEKRLPNLTRTSAKLVYDDIDRSGKEISKARERIDELSKQLMSSNDQIIDLKVAKSDHHDIGTLQFVANALDLKIEQVVNWFTLIIVLVFDPLALSLVLAYNSLIKKESIIKEKEEVVIVKKKIIKEVEEEIEEPKPAFVSDVVEKKEENKTSSEVHDYINNINPEESIVERITEKNKETENLRTSLGKYRK